jgi:hypothetical protein
MTTYREFVVDSFDMLKRVFGILLVMLKTVLAAKKSLRIIATTDDKKRNGEQNARLWGYLYATIAEQAWVDGRQYGKDTWHEFFARKYCPKTEFVLPGGEIVSRRKSTAEMNVGEFSEFMNAVESEAATELGVCFE